MAQEHAIYSVCVDSVLHLLAVSAHSQGCSQVFRDAEVMRPMLSSVVLLQGCIQILPLQIASRLHLL